MAIPCHIDNDVKSATRAERVWGFGQISKNFIYINVGTGIAVGTVINGRQIRGSHFNAGEVGTRACGSESLALSVVVEEWIVWRPLLPVSVLTIAPVFFATGMKPICISRQKRENE